MEVDYQLRVDCFPEGKMIIRHLLLLWTGDHPAQCEVGKSKSSGAKKGCRRCKLEGDYFLVSLFVLCLLPVLWCTSVEYNCFVF